MRYANPPGLAAFYVKNVGYDLLGAQGVRDSVANDLAAMGSIAKAQSTGLEVAGKDEAADELRKAGAYAAAQQRGADTFGAITGAVGTIGSAGIKKYGSSNPFRDPSPTDIKTDNLDLADSWRNAGGDVYWDSGMDIGTSILR